MQRNTDRTEAASDRRRKGKSSGWLAFVLGMAGMFVVMALWIALVETAEDPAADVEFIGLPQSAEGPSRPAASAKDEPTSSYR